MRNTTLTMTPIIETLLYDKRHRGGAVTAGLEQLKALFDERAVGIGALLGMTGGPAQGLQHPSIRMGCAVHISRARKVKNE